MMEMIPVQDATISVRRSSEEVDPQITQMTQIVPSQGRHHVNPGPENWG